MSKSNRYIYETKSGKWQARVYTGKKKLLTIGLFDTEEEAIQGRNKFVAANANLVNKGYRPAYKRRSKEEEAFTEKEETTVVTAEEPPSKPTGMTFTIDEPKVRRPSSMTLESQGGETRDFKALMDKHIYPQTPNTILLLSDMHFPYNHQDAIPFIQKIMDEMNKPDLIVILGDEIDSHALSFYPYHPALANATLELKLARECIAKLSEMFGDIPVIAVESNHTSRVYRKAKSAGIPREMILPYNQLLGVDWEWAKDWVIPLPNGTNLLCSHTKGMNTRMAGQVAGSNIACGHFHKRGGIEWWTTMMGQEFFAMSCPCLIDFDSAAYSYDENSVNRPNLGAMIIQDSLPFHINMFVDGNNRWTKDLFGQVVKKH